MKQEQEQFKGLISIINGAVSYHRTDTNKATGKESVRDLTFQMSSLTSIEKLNEKANWMPYPPEYIIECVVGGRAIRLFYRDDFDRRDYDYSILQAEMRSMNIRRNIL